MNARVPKTYRMVPVDGFLYAVRRRKLEKLAGRVEDDYGYLLKGERQSALSQG